MTHLVFGPSLATVEKSLCLSSPRRQRFAPVDALLRFIRLAASLLATVIVLGACGGGGSSGVDGSAAVASGATERESLQAVGGSSAVTAQYVRLEATSEVNGNAWASIAEFNVVDGNGAVVPRTGWIAVADSQETVGESAPAGNAIDGDSGSFWHTQWMGAAPAMPHTFTVNLGASRVVGGFKYLPRQVGTNGRIAGYRFYTSADGKTWTLATEGTFPNGAAESTVLLQAPVVTTVANRMDPVGRAVTQNVVATDASGSTLTYSASGLPVGTTIDSRTGVVSGTPTAVGVYAATVQASNGRATASSSFTWTIAVSGGAGITARYVRLEATSEVNGNPWASVADFNVIDAGGSVVARSGWSARADSEELVGENSPARNAIDADPNSFWHTQWQGASPPLPHALTVDLGAVRSIGGFKYLPRQIGVNGRIAGYRFYTSTDGTAWTLATSGVFPTGAAESTVRFTGRSNQPPVLAALAARSDIQGQPVVQSVTATDADGDRLTYSATGLPTGLAIDAATGTVSGTPTASGTFAATVGVSDGVDAASTSFTWTITAPGAAIGARYVRLEAISEVNGNPWTSMAEFNVVDGSGATLSRSGWSVVADSQETVAENDPARNAIDGDPNTYWHTQWQGGNAPMPHTFTVDLGATRQVGGFKYLPRQNGINGRIAGYRFYTSADGASWQLATQGTFTAGSTAEQTKTIPPGVANRSPVLATLPTTRSDVVGTATSLSLSASDPDGDPLTYAASGLPAGLSINAASGLISGTPSRAETASTTVSVGDGRGGSAAQTFTWSIAAGAPASGSSGSNPPIVFNATTSAVAGDVISLQGEFGAAPVVYLDGYPAKPLEIVNRVGSGWLAVQVPTTATGSLILRIANATGISAQIKLNAARPHHLDTTRINAGGPFRLFGRNLKMAGSTPTVTVNGLAATIDLANSDEHLLAVTAPAALAAASVATIVVDNGNGSGASALDPALDRPASVVVAGSGDPFALGVGWASAFTAITSRPIDPATDPRIADKAVCNGTHDDFGAIQQAIDLAAANGGGVVQLPAGRCATSGIVTLRSKVVVRGAGKASTELWHTKSTYPLAADSVDLSGLSDLTLTNALDGSESVILKNSTRVFLKNVRIRVGTSRQMYLTGNTDFVVANTDIEQTGNVWQQGPYTFANNAGFVFENNTTIWAAGAPTFGRIHDSSIRTSRFTRNATDQSMGSVVHSLTIDFAYRASVVGNVLDVLAGPIRNKARNDGETILTEGGGADRTENLGTVGSATGTTMTDPANTLNVDPFATGSIPENYGIAIVSGKGAGQMRHVVGYRADTHVATVDRAWDVVPDGSSRYATFVFGLERVLIKGNTLSQNPRGIWLYNTALREIDVVGNTITDGGGIYVRSYQNVATHTFTPIYGILIKDNRISNATGEWMSYINVVMVVGNASAFGTGIIGVEVRNNAITANRPNVTSGLEEYANIEGMMARMPLETGSAYQGTTTPRVLGTIFNGNTCTYCDVAVRIGTGADGTTILNTRLSGSATLYTDTSYVPSGEKSTGTVVR